MGYMKFFSKYCLYIFALSTVTFLFQNCDDNPAAPSNAAVIQGKVVQSETGRGIPDVLVRSFSFPETARTDSSGLYSFEISIGDSSQRSVALSFTKDGFQDAFISLTIQNGVATAVPNAEMKQTGVVTETSGPAASVILVTVQNNQIFVKGSGAREASNLTFEVRDANDVPVDSEHEKTVNFSISNGLGGGEFLSPLSAKTDNNGRVSTTINSGTIAGAIQIIAKVADTLISSSPVPIAITGGLPDASHFSMGAQKVNFVGFNTINNRNAITVLVGDKYSNPVPTGTSVQFQTTGGIIQGSATTDNDGVGGVELISGGPQPQGVPFQSLRVINAASLPGYFNQPGYALLTAQTVNENGASIYAEHVVLFSGITQISNVAPLTFNLVPNANQSFNFDVSDQNSNPLSEGTKITVSTNNGSVAGAVNVELDDTRSRDVTSFSFLLSNSKPEDIEGTATTVTISVESDNGRASFSITGEMKKQ